MATTFSVNPDLSYTEEGRPWYDTKKGVGIVIKTLSGFLNLREERYQAGYIRKENLNQLYVLGDYSFDTVGNCAVAQPSIKKIHTDIPDVLTHEEYWKFINKDKKPEDLYGFCFAYDQNIPSEHVYCPFCKKSWSIKNVYDVVTWRIGKQIMLTDFIGKSLREVKEFYEAKTDADYFISGEPFLQNDSFKDDSPWTLTPKDEFEKTMVKNSNGWVGTRDGITNDYIIKQDDMIDFAVVHYFHSECNSKNLEIEEFNSFKEIFTKAGFSKIELKSIPNEYCKCNRCAPWFEVITEFGIFKIGWRKRVINIDCSGLNKKIDSLRTIFAEENVTTGDTSIHAWGNEKAVEYLSKIFILLL